MFISDLIIMSLNNPVFINAFQASKILNKEHMRSLEEAFGIEIQEHRLNFKLYLPKQKIQFSVLGNSVFVLAKNTFDSHKVK